MITHDLKIIKIGKDKDQRGEDQRRDHSCDARRYRRRSRHGRSRELHKCRYRPSGPSITGIMQEGRSIFIDFSISAALYFLALDTIKTSKLTHQLINVLIPISVCALLFLFLICEFCIIFRPVPSWQRNVPPRRRWWARYLYREPASWRRMESSILLI